MCATTQRTVARLPQILRCARCLLGRGPLGELRRVAADLVPRRVVGDLKVARDLEAENAKLKRIVADQLLDIEGLKELARGNF